MLRRVLTTPGTAYAVSLLASSAAYALMLGGTVLYARWQSWDMTARQSRLLLVVMLSPAWLAWGAGVWAVARGSRGWEQARARLKRWTVAWVGVLRVVATVASVVLFPSLLLGWMAGTDAAEHAAKGICHDHIESLLRLLPIEDRRAGVLEVAATDWSDRLLSRDADPNAFVCPAVRRLKCGYAFNAALRGVPYSAIENPRHTVAIFESDEGWNAAGGPELLPDKPRHFGGDNYGFADGHVQWIKRKKLPDGTWAKEPEADWVIWEPELKGDTGNTRPAP